MYAGLESPLSFAYDAGVKSPKCNFQRFTEVMEKNNNANVSMETGQSKVRVNPSVAH